MPSKGMLCCPGRTADCPLNARHTHWHVRDLSEDVVGCCLTDTDVAGDVASSSL